MLKKARPTMVLYPPAVRHLSILSPMNGAIAVVRDWLQEAGMPVDEYDIQVVQAAIQVEGVNLEKIVITAPEYGDRAETLVNLMRTDPVATVEQSQHFLMPVLDRLIDSGGPPTVSGSMKVVDNLDEAPSLDEHRAFEGLTCILAETMGEVTDQKMAAYHERLAREQAMEIDNDANLRGFVGPGPDGLLPGNRPGGPGAGGY